MRLLLKSGYVCLICFVLSGAAGCVSVQTQEPIVHEVKPQQPRVGVYHKVRKGETLWRIAQTYNTSVEDLARANNIPKVATIEENQLVFIPGAETVKEILLEPLDKQDEFSWPVDGRVIRYFQQRNGDQLSQGIDIKVRAGEEVKASRTGKVVFADYLTGYGFTVILDHLDGFYTVYARNSNLLVELGELVNKHTTVAHVGYSPNSSYLHFQIRKNSQENNPLHYLP